MIPISIIIEILDSFISIKLKGLTWLGDLIYGPLNKKERRKKEFDFSNLFLYVLLCVLMVGTAEGYGC